MRKTVPGFAHETGKHCGTTSVRGLLAFHGHRYSEAMCLGLAGGLDAAYAVADEMSPTRFLGGRHFFLEEDCFKRLGVGVTVMRTDDAALAWSWVRDEIDAGRPAMIQVDIRWLEYYRTKTHFGGHKILVVGYDDEAETALVSDSEFPEIQELPQASLAKARAGSVVPWALRNDWFCVEVPPTLVALETAVPAAIADLAARMTAERGELLGLAALDRAAREMPHWGEAADWQWCARFNYQMIEKRGTGGGAFRKLYARFLREAEAVCDDVRRLGLVEQMDAIATAWTRLAACLREISERDQPAGFDVAAALLAGVARRERDFFAMAQECTRIDAPDAG